VLFTSLQWVVFLLLALGAYHLSPAGARRWVMLGASVVFYASWSAPYLALIGAQLLVDWTCGFLLSRTEAPARRKALVAASVTLNLGALCLFKYHGLLTLSLSWVGVRLPAVHLLLPLAISFYTFESMSYTIDVYRRQLAPVRSPIHLALFITWFPHLIAGPIIRPSEFIPQLQGTPAITRERFFSGLSLMAIGYTKKLLGADWLARVSDPIFADPAPFSSLDILIGVYAYAFQIYLDFSAYTDIARGASRWFGIELPENFDDPYLATSITDFWRRWHLTLSHWLRDYLYVSLGGNRHGTLRTYVNLFLTMLLGGLWHGASWTFLVWGGLHGLWLAIERALGVRATARHVGPARWWRQALTFHLVCLAWVLFRAPSFALARGVFAGIGRGELAVTPARVLPALGTALLVGGYWLLAPLRAPILAFDPGPGLARQGAFALSLGLLSIVLLALGASSHAFIYFQF
jgi:D-alanyl-lipoteichoic acid acyltransferase DltB (MBOAT superfamily)